MVRHAAQILRPGLRRQDRQAGVNLKGVGADNLRPEPPGEGQGQGGFADTGGTGEVEDFRVSSFDSRFYGRIRRAGKAKGPAL
jgi:hypothetical protein